MAVLVMMTVAVSVPMGVIGLLRPTARHDLRLVGAFLVALMSDPVVRVHQR